MGRRRGRSCARAAVASVDGQVVAEAELVIVIEAVPAASRARRCRSPALHPRDGHRAPGRRDRRGHASSARTRRSARTSRSAAHCRVGASAVIDGCTEIGDDTEIYPFASIGLAPQDLKFKGEPTRLVDRPAQRLPRVRDDPPRHGRRRRRDDDRRPQPVHGLRARRARLPRRQLHDLRQRRDARRARDASRTSRRSAPTRACTSSAASASTRSSAATPW